MIDAPVADDVALRLRLYRSMLRIRRIEEEIVNRYPEQEMRCPVHLSIGQEGVSAGVCEALEAGDRVFSGHRSHGHYIAKGGNLGAMMAEIYGKATGCAHGRGGSMHLLDLEAGFLGSVPIVGSTIPIAAGAAFTSRLTNDERVTAVFFGEGAAEAGVFHETLNFAALKKLPLLFVCENNLYSVYSPMEVRQPRGLSIAGLARAHGLLSLEGDGNDAEQVYELTHRAVHHARAGKGPAFMEFSTYRWREHCGPNYDNDIGYRTPKEFEQWRKRDPLALLQARLGGSVRGQADMAAIEAEIAREVAAAFDFARSSPFPDAATAPDRCYA